MGVGWWEGVRGDEVGNVVVVEDEQRVADAPDDRSGRSARTSSGGVVAFEGLGFRPRGKNGCDLSRIYY